MANISTEKLTLKDGTKFLKVVKYSKGKFTIDLPDVVCKDLLYTEKKDTILSADTESLVNNLFTSKLKEWDSAMTTIIKVILFQAKFQGALAKKSFKSKWEKGYTPSYEQNGISNSSDLWEFISHGIDHTRSSLGMTLQWAVYHKIQSKNNVKYECVSGRYFDHFDLRGGNLGSYITEIEHTPQRENFFLELDHAFATMIANAYKALGDLTPEKLIRLTESKMKLLS